MAQPIIQPSFAAGELSPTLFARVDLAKYHVGAALLRNFFVDYRGGVSNRAGTKFVCRCLPGTNRIIEFIFSTVQAYVLLFSDEKMRVIMDGGLVLETALNITGISNAATGVVTVANSYTNGDWVFISGVVGMTQVNGRYFIVAGATGANFQLNDLNGDPVDTSLYGTWLSGGTVARVYTVATPWDASDLAALKFTQSADVMTVVHPEYPPYDITRTAHNSWTVTVVTFGATIAAPAAAPTLAGGAGDTSYGYKITAVDENGQESVASPRGLIRTTKLTSGNNYVDVQWLQVTGATSYNIYRTLEFNAASGPARYPPVGAPYGYIATTFGNQYIDGNTAPDFTKTPPLHRNPFAVSAITAVTITADGSGYNETTSTVTVTGAPGTGFAGEPVVNTSGDITAVVIANGGSGYVSPVVAFPTGGGSGATATATVGPASGTYPSVVSYFQQRLTYAATLNEPQNIWFSKIGSFDNFDTSTPSRDDDAVSVALVSQQVNAIKSIVSMPSGLIVLTSYGAWQVSGGGVNAPITPGNTIAQAQAYNGCSDVAPLVVNFNILYVQAKGAAVRSLAYDFGRNVYTGTDISVLSSHLFYGHEIVDWCYCEEPHKIVWAVRDDGELLSLTYLQEQDVYGWAHSDTDGSFLDTCSIPGGDRDIPYFIVEREVESEEVQYVELMADRLINGDLANAWFLDSALRYEGAPTTTVTAADHLNGVSCSALIDGEPYAGIVVSDGVATLPVAGSVVVLGLPYTQRIQTLPVDIGEPTVQGKRKKISALTVPVAETLKLKAGMTFETAVFIKEFDTLTDGKKRLIMDPLWGVEGQYCIEQPYPLPASVLGVIPEITVGDTR